MKFTYASGSRPLDGYTIKRGVGRGGFGEVYYAVSDGGKEVALKLVRRNLDVELRGMQQCLNLKHPHLLALFDIRNDDNDDAWIVMEYVVGESLDRVIDRHPQGMAEADVLRWINELGSGVAYLHDHGIVHRDLKPANIFSDEGVVKIGDYGLSKFISCSRRSGQTESVGTVHYMAPEVANGRYGKEIDIYALGIVLYEMLTGEVPFEGESIGEVLMKHLTAEPDLSKVRAPFRPAVSAALDKDPEKRVGSVRELLALLPTSASDDPKLTLGPPPLPDRRRRTAAQNSATRETQPGGAALPAAAAVAAAPEEPIWRAMREAGGQLRDAWVGANFNLLTKVILLGLGIFVLASSGAVVFPAVICGAIVYAMYWVARAITLGAARNAKSHAATAKPQPAQPPPVQRTQERPRDQWHRMGKHQHGYPTPPPYGQHVAAPPKPARERVTELFGSLFTSALITSTLGLVMYAFIDTQQPQQFAWLMATSTLAAWAVMVPTKLWEGNPADPLLRRVVMLGLGVLVGAASFGAQELLFVDLLPGSAFASHIHFASAGSSGWLFQADGSPALGLHIAFFGFLMLLLRWWKQAELTRWTRLSFWSVIICSCFALLLSLAWPFPQPWGILAAATTAIAVQLSSPWFDTARLGRIV